MPRTTESDLSKVIKRKGYGIAASIGKTTISSETGCSRESRNLEQRRGHEPLRQEAVEINYSGICVVRIKFFRKRLADYSRANCEKYLIDSAVYAGIIRDDSEKEIRLIDEGQVKVATEAEERVEITFEYPEVDFTNLWVPRRRIGNIGKG